MYLQEQWCFKDFCSRKRIGGDIGNNYFTKIIVDEGGDSDHDDAVGIICESDGV